MAEAASVDPFSQAKRRFVYALLAIAGGLGIAGTLDQGTGGVLVLIGWIFGVASLHRLGRTGSDRTAAPARTPASVKASGSELAAKDDDADVGS